MTKFGVDLIQAMSEALAYSQGKEVTGIKVQGVEVCNVDAKATRKKLDLTPDEIVTVLPTSPSGYKKMRTGQRRRVGCAQFASHMEKSRRRCCVLLSTEDEASAAGTAAAKLRAGEGLFAALIFARHLGWPMAKLLLDMAVLGRGGEAGAQ
ncbi:MAG: hypothetical protein EOS41_29930 [Mesorhizobium sp.]|uniref:hypothetical protein n=1 Tax=Mesorhizobium sp. TaxID=1871066 RepID=UPI000FE4774E|nr:hypothetical protein [Mesorhizobium sp.]RWE19721.1 MAG: hypothetical protein EOS41_29930 [Mesorhizobium sp.]